MASLASWAICILAARKGLFFGPVVLVFDLIYHVFSPLLFGMVEASKLQGFVV